MDQGIYVSMMIFASGFRHPGVLISAVCVLLIAIPARAQLLR